MGGGHTAATEGNHLPSRIVITYWTKQLVKTMLIYLCNGTSVIWRNGLYLLVFGVTSISHHYSKHTAKLPCQITRCLQKAIWPPLQHNEAAAGQMRNQSWESHIQRWLVVLSSWQGIFKSSCSIRSWKKTGLLSPLVLEVTSLKLFMLYFWNVSEHHSAYKHFRHLFCHTAKSDFFNQRKLS